MRKWSNWLKYKSRCGVHYLNTCLGISSRRIKVLGWTIVTRNTSWRQAKATENSKTKIATLFKSNMPQNDSYFKQWSYYISCIQNDVHFVKRLNPLIFSATEKHLKPISRNFGDQNMLFCNFGNFTCFYVDPLAGPLWPMISCCVCYFKRTNNSPTYFLPQAFSKCYFSKEKASTPSVVNWNSPRKVVSSNSKNVTIPCW